MPELYAGVMSGTSLDGIDAVIADFATTQGTGCELIAAARAPFAAELRTELLALQSAGFDELNRAARAANALADAYAECIAQALSLAGLAASDLTAAGVHGQTLRHRPDESWTLQLNNPARVAERAGVTVVADFRSRDVAAGGQGAPLVPAFHAALFGNDAHRVVVNLGGIANISDLPPHGIVRGFDTGPGNVLLDLWSAKHGRGNYDRNGAWSATGRVDQPLLRTMLCDPFFAEAPPKSTGRDRFNGAWLDAVLTGCNVAAADVQGTLVALTARTIADAVRNHCAGASEVLVCGGGANNGAMMTALVEELAPRRVGATSAYGVGVEHVEALAFAWLARQAVVGRSGNLPAVTGARGPRVLGAIYPR
jgi:anhydro-N-acetylmuramic acid kinase